MADLQRVRQEAVRQFTGNPRVAKFVLVTTEPVFNSSVPGGWRIQKCDPCVQVDLVAPSKSFLTDSASHMAGRLASKLGMPDGIFGLPVKYRFTERVELQHYLSTDPVSQVVTDTKAYANPMVGGVSYGHEDITTGTYSGPVWRKSDGQLMLLTNAHVANHPLANPGDAMLQPGPYDGGTKRVGTHWTYHPITIDVTNPLDAALAEWTGERDIQFYEYAVLGVVDPKPAADIPEPGTFVKSVGRNNEYEPYTEGSAIRDDVYINVGWPDGNVYTFGPVIEIWGQGGPGVPPPGGFSEGGRSGSRVWNGNTMEPVGIIFAGSPGGASFAIKATLIDELMGMSFVPVEPPVGDLYGPSETSTELVITVTEPVVPPPVVKQSRLLWTNLNRTIEAGDPVTLKGRLEDRATMAPVPLREVIVHDDSGADFPVQTDPEGYFSLVQHPDVVREHRYTASFVGDPA